jgi:hypothetical protein
VLRGVRIEREGALCGIGSGHRFEHIADFTHADAVLVPLSGLGKRHVGDVVPLREVAHQVPRPQLSALI